MNYRNVGFASALIISGCGGVPADFYTAYGSPVYLHVPDWISEQTATDLQNGMFVCLQYPPQDSRLYDPDAQHALRWANYSIKTFPVPCPAHPGQNCAGYQDGHELVIGAGPGDPHTSSFVHETIHYLQEFRLGVYDPNHRRPEWICQ